MVFIRNGYLPAISGQNDFLGAIGVYTFHIISSVPETTMNYASIIQPFDPRGWAWIATSAISILTSLLLINKVSVTKMKKMKMTIHKSTYI